MGNIHASRIWDYAFDILFSHNFIFWRLEHTFHQYRIISVGKLDDGKLLGSFLVNFQNLDFNFSTNVGSLDLP